MRRPYSPLPLTHWYPRWDSNPHALRRGILNPTDLLKIQPVAGFHSHRHCVNEPRNGERRGASSLRVGWKLDASAFKAIL